ncbi:MAG: response regulator transcription factor [Candidatus Binataceae bacterium]
MDDDESVRDGLDSLLRSLGYETALFVDAESFLASARLPDFACLILDLQMPGMNGLGLQRQLSRASRAIPIIFVTGHPDEETRKQALSAGAVGYLSKPFSEAELLGAVQSTLAGRGKGQPPLSAKYCRRS